MLATLDFLNSWGFPSFLSLRSRKLSTLDKEWFNFKKELKSRKRKEITGSYALAALIHTPFVTHQIHNLTSQWFFPVTERTSWCKTSLKINATSRYTKSVTRYAAGSKCLINKSQHFDIDSTYFFRLIAFQRLKKRNNKLIVLFFLQFRASAAQTSVPLRFWYHGEKNIARTAISSFESNCFLRHTTWSSSVLTRCHFPLSWCYHSLTNSRNRTRKYIGNRRHKGK